MKRGASGRHRRLIAKRCGWPVVDNSHVPGSKVTNRRCPAKYPRSNAPGRMPPFAD